jgi:hypothetical protein
MPDVLDRIGDQLIAAERALHTAAVSPEARVPSLGRRLRSVARRHLVVVAMLVGVSGSAGGFAIADSLGGSTLTDQQYLYQGQHAVPVTAMTADQTQDLAILRRARTPADAIPSGAIVPGIAAGEDGANLDLSRLAQVDDGTGAWVIPAADGLVCLAVGPVDPDGGPGGGGPGCLPVTSSSPAAQSACDGPNCNDSVPPGETVSDGDLSAGYGTGDTSRSNAPGYLVGVVPDGVNAVTLTLYGGATESVPVHDNVWSTPVRHAGYLPVYANLGEDAPPPSAPPTLTITFTSPEGTVTDHPLGPQGTTYTFTN